MTNADRLGEAAQIVGFSYTIFSGGFYENF